MPSRQRAFLFFTLSAILLTPLPYLWKKSIFYLGFVEPLKSLGVILFVVLTILTLTSILFALKGTSLVGFKKVVQVLIVGTSLLGVVSVLPPISKHLFQKYDQLSFAYTRKRAPRPPPPGFPTLDPRATPIQMIVYPQVPVDPLSKTYVNYSSGFRVKYPTTYVAYDIPGNESSDFNYQTVFREHVTFAPNSQVMPDPKIVTLNINSGKKVDFFAEYLKFRLPRDEKVTITAEENLSTKNISGIKLVYSKKSRGEDIGWVYIIFEHGNTTFVLNSPKETSDLFLNSIEFFTPIDIHQWSTQWNYFQQFSLSYPSQLTATEENSGVLILKKDQNIVLEANLVSDKPFIPLDNSWSDHDYHFKSFYFHEKKWADPKKPTDFKFERIDLEGKIFYRVLSGDFIRYVGIIGERTLEIKDYKFLPEETVLRILSTTI